MKNRINFSQVSPVLWQNLTQLLTLYICDQKCILDSIFIYNDQLFASLANLQDLAMDGLPNSTFGKGFSSLHSLQSLRLHGRLQYITNDTFKQFSNSPLTTFVVRSSILTDVDSLAFHHFRQLETLDLSFNPRLGFTNVSKSWYNMTTTLSTLILKTSAPYQFNINQINKNFLHDLQQTNLTKLVLDANNIVAIDAFFCLYTRHLTHLSLAYNRLVHIWDIMVDIYFLPHLEVFDMSFQSNALAISDSDSTLDETVDTTYPSLSMSLLEAKTLVILFPPNIRIVKAAASLTTRSKSVTNILALGTHKLQVLNVSQNNLQKLVGPLYIAIPPQDKFTMDLGINACIWLHPHFFDQCGPHIDKLYLGQNRLGPQLAGGENSSIFQNLTELVRLDLSANDIKKLPREVFSKQIRLQYLNLRSNSLRLANFSFLHMNLSYLDLSSNLFDQLIQSAREDMDQLARRGKLIVDLTDNPLQCSCNSLAFLRWVLQTKVTLKNWDQYICMYGKQLVDFSQLETVILPRLQVECHSKAWLIAASTNLASLGILLGIAFILYTYRFEIKYRCLLCCRSHVPQLPDIYEYDAFVAFDQRDKSWVDEHLIPSLDSQSGEGEFKLLIHHRDFPPGEPIMDNVMRGIMNSRKIIVVVSQHFVDSNWCEFELRMSRERCFDEGKELIIAILLDETLPAKLSKTLRMLLNSNTYIKWPDDPNEIPNFWHNLKRALGSKHNRIGTCQCGNTMNLEN